MNELKPCPFCGGDAEFANGVFWGCELFKVRCGNKDKCLILPETGVYYLLHLADLIDRPTTTRHGKFKTKYGRETPCCEVCGYSIGDMRWNYCPKCGSVITDAK